MTRRWAPILIAGCAALMMVAGCGGRGDASHSADAGDASAARADAAAAAAFVKKHTTPDESSLSLPPLNSAPPSDKLLVFIAGKQPANTVEFDGITAAASEFGWKTRQLVYEDTSPAAFAQMMDEALQFKPTAVAMSGAPAEDSWKQMIPKYKAAGVTIIPAFSVLTEPKDETVIASPGDKNNINAQGEALAQWVIADSGGKANVIVHSWTDLPIAAGVAPKVLQTLKADCAQCTATLLPFTTSDINSGAVVQDMVSQLQKAPDTTYVINDVSAVMTNLPSALKTAGIENVKIVGAACSAENLKHVVDGTEAACTSQPYQLAGWSIFDAELRHMAGMSTAPSEAPFPLLLLTKDNTQYWKPSDSVNIPSNYPDLYKKAWGLAQ